MKTDNRDLFQIETDDITGKTNKEIAATIREFGAFQMEHEVQIIRGHDYQYYFTVNRECFGVHLTFIGALFMGFEQYKIYLKCGKDINLYREYCKNKAKENLK